MYFNCLIFTNHSDAMIIPQRNEGFAFLRTLAKEKKLHITIAWKRLSIPMSRRRSTGI